MTVMALAHSRNTAPQDADRNRWTAVLSRDRAADGRFVYGVTSTGVFCRPSCPSRRPLRARVRFFDQGSDAVQAGFRACLRCRPLEASGDPWLAKVQAACAAIARADAPPSLATLARAAGSSPYHFLRNFRRVIGVTPREFADARRFADVKARLRAQADVTTAFLDAGYGGSSRFYEGAAPRLAMTPSAYRAGAQGQHLQYATASCALGRVLVAATAKGICSVALGDADAPLVAALRDEFPHASIARAPREMRAWVAQIVEHLAGRLPHLELPLDVRATAFQWQVWNALRTIPRGDTRTYADVATAIGRPRSARAVARACATNPVALLIPCHRIVPAAGGVGGYRWGSSRKQALLTRERRRT